MKNENLKLQSPWETLRREMEELFGKDPDISVVYNSDGGAGSVPEIKLLVEGTVKADALAQILPSEKNYGGQVVKITVVPANNGVQSPGSLFRAAFNGNPAVSDIQVIPDFTGTDVTYVLFAKEVVQFQNDNIGSPTKITSTLYEDIAQEVFEGDFGGVFFSTDTVDEKVCCLL